MAVRVRKSPTSTAIGGEQVNHEEADGFAFDGGMLIVKKGEEHVAAYAESAWAHVWIDGPESEAMSA